MSNAVVMQRIEAACLFVGCVVLYVHLHFSILWFVILLFIFDIFMLGYLKDNRIGAYIYNFGHSLIAPVVLVVCGTLFDLRLLVGLGIIWAAHIGFDRMLGYGLKLETGFQHTHLGDIGKKR